LISYDKRQDLWRDDAEMADEMLHVRCSGKMEWEKSLLHAQLNLVPRVGLGPFSTLSRLKYA